MLSLSYIYGQSRLNLIMNFIINVKGISIILSYFEGYLIITLLLHFFSLHLSYVVVINYLLLLYKSFFFSSFIICHIRVVAQKSVVLFYLNYLTNYTWQLLIIIKLDHETSFHLKWLRKQVKSMIKALPRGTKGHLLP